MMGAKFRLARLTISTDGLDAFDFAFLTYLFLLALLHLPPTLPYLH
jgi:hypothetical protein